MRQNHPKWQGSADSSSLKKRFLVSILSFSVLFLGTGHFLSCSPKNEASSSSAINGFLYRMFNSFDPRSFLENMGKNVIPPLYQDLATKADSLKSDADNLCGSVTVSQFQNTWKQNIAALKKVEIFQFGPAVGPYAKVDSFPFSYISETPPVADDMDLIDQFVGNAGQAALYVDPVAGPLPKDSKGIVGIEYLAFSQADPSRGTAPDCTSLQQNSSSRLLLLRAMVNQYKVNVHAMTDLWDSGAASPYGDQLAAGTAFSSSAAALDAIYGGTIQLLTAMKDGRLEIPAGLAAGGNGSIQDLERAESRFSANSFQNLSDNLSAFKAVYTGNGTGAGLSDYVKFYSPALDTEILQKITAVETDLTALNSTGWTNVPNLKTTVADLGEILKILNVELAALIGTSPVSGGPGGDGD
ncbi:imelysin [Leptospira wolffii]|uniref:imelysin family protein n=1 Tax=Leptospira wolffii TaxID=409998 RepID=UPI001083672C|nr:imelysin family protein [Leptospira wolffii]TGL55374.1 imelysin [Leptospira wolffii]